MPDCRSQPKSTPVCVCEEAVNCFTITVKCKFVELVPGSISKSRTKCHVKSSMPPWSRFASVVGALLVAGAVHLLFKSDMGLAQETGGILSVIRETCIIQLHRYTYCGKSHIIWGSMSKKMSDETLLCMQSTHCKLETMLCLQVSL